MFLKFCNVIKTNFAYKLQLTSQLKISAKNFTYTKKETGKADYLTLEVIGYLRFV